MPNICTFEPAQKTKNIRLNLHWSVPLRHCGLRSYSLRIYVYLTRVAFNNWLLN